MRILFVTRHFGCLRNFERAIVELAARGHAVHLLGLQDDILGGQRLVDRLAAEHPGITAERSPVGRATRASDVATKVRLALDYLRYLEPAYAATPRLRRRAWERTPRALLWLLKMPGLPSRRGRRALASALRALERALPRDPAIDAYLRVQALDVVLLTPLIGLGSPELDYFLAAKALGLRTVFCVWSWDNLSSKALIRAWPDAVTVWNETQKREAIELHGVPAELVEVTGAQCFDHWFERRPSRPRAEFCARVGLPQDRPFVLYVCSALFYGSPVEAEFVARWIREIRNEPALREVAILVRPHPSRLKEWQRVSLADLGPTAFWGANPIDADAKADYFDSLYYSAAVVGLNTSAFIEAAIVGRPVLTLLLPEFWENQEGTLHFPYLLTVGGGLLHAARDWPTHRAQLAGALADHDGYAAKGRRFVEAFVRPRGREVSGTEAWVGAIERVLRQPAPAPLRSPATWSPARLAERALTALAPFPGPRHLLMDPLEAEEARARAERLQQDRAAKAMRQREARRERAARIREKATVRWKMVAKKREGRRQKQRVRRARLRARRLRPLLVMRDRVKARLRALIGVGGG